MIFLIAPYKSRTLQHAEKNAAQVKEFTRKARSNRNRFYTSFPHLASFHLQETKMELPYDFVRLQIHALMQTATYIILLRPDKGAIFPDVVDQVGYAILHGLEMTEIEAHEWQT